MPKPIPGQQYTVQPGDTLSDIASRAYGLPAEHTRIMNANGITNADKIIVGQVLIIPVIPELETIKRRFFAGSVKDEGFVLKLGDRILPVQSGKLVMDMSKPADQWSARIAWEPGLDTELDKLTAPFSYSPAQVYLDGELKLTGRLWIVRQKNTENGRIKELEGMSLSGDIAESNLQNNFQFDSSTLEQLNKDILNKTMGIAEKLDEGVKVDGQFILETARYTETIYQYLLRMSNIKNVLQSSSPDGGLLLTKAKLDGPTIGTISEEKDQIVESWEGEFNGHDLYNTYQAIRTGSKKVKNKIATLVDPLVPFYRVMNFKVDAGDIRDLPEIVKWKRNLQLAKAMTLDLPVTTWLGPDDEIWRPNTKVTIESPTLGVPAGFTFLIPKVELEWDGQGRTGAVSILPPTVYSNLEPDLPWVKKDVSISVEDLKLSSKTGK